MTGKPIQQLAVADAAESGHVMSPALIAEFVALLGDRNPIHRDTVFAASTPFGEPIAPGALTAALISAVIGTTLPGPGTIYLSQSLKFLRPVRMDDRITAHRVRLGTRCTNQRGEPVLLGEAWVRPPQTAIHDDDDVDCQDGLALAALGSNARQER